MANNNSRKNNVNDRPSAAELRETAVDLALTRFDREGVEGLPKSLDPPPERIDLDWTILPVTPSVENEVAKFVVQRGEYGWMNDHDVAALAKSLEDRGLEMTVDQALSLRKAILQQKSVYRHGRMMRESDRLLRDYDNGQGIIAISRNRDYPPLNVMRAIFSARRWSKKRIKEAMKDPDRRLKGRDLKEYREAAEQDRISSADQSETHDRSARFETVLANHLASHDVRFRTQEELVEEQTSEHGRATNTPDILLLDQLHVNGDLVAWIDAKHYYGANLDFPIRKTRKQMRRYVEMWGQGAIVYRHGFNNAISIPGVVLLDATPLDLSAMHVDEGS